MSIRVSNNFRLQAMINGKTLMAGIRLVPNSTPLTQALDQNYTPSVSWVNNGPEFYAWVRDTDGVEYVPSNLTLVWNGVEVKASNISTVEIPDSSGNAVKGVFSIGTANVLINGTTQAVPTFKVVKNVFGSNNLDSDSFYIKGTITLAGGRTQDFFTDTETARVRLYNTGDKLYEVEMVATDANESAAATVMARLLNLTTGEYVSGVSPTFYNLDGAGSKTAVSGVTGYSVSGSVLTIQPSKINGFDNFAAKFTVGSDDYWGACSVRDLSDHIYVSYNISGNVEGDEVDEDGVANIEIYVTDKDGNPLTSWNGIASGKVLQPNIVLKKDDGSAISLSSQTPTSIPCIENYSGTWAALAALSIDGKTSKIYYKADNWKGLLRITYKALMEAGGSVQGWISLDEV